MIAKGFVYTRGPEDTEEATRLCRRGLTVMPNARMIFWK